MEVELFFLGLNYISLKDFGRSLSNAFDEIDQSFVDNLEDEILKRIGGSSNIFLVGNGGSAANAHHIVGDYSKTFAVLGKSINIISLSDNSCYITALSNDIDYSEVYEILINTKVNSRDLLIFLSGSGNSMNLIKAARSALKKNIKTAAIVGYTGGALKKLVDIPIHVKMNDMEIAEDSQMAIFHYIKQNLQKKLDKNKNNNSKYNKRVNEDLIA